MCRQFQEPLPKTVRELEQRVHEKVFGRVRGKATPQYSSDPEAMSLLLQRLESQGLLVRTTAHGLEIEDLTMRMSYYYGAGMRADGSSRIGGLIVRSALFTVAARHALHRANPKQRPSPGRLLEGYARNVA